MDAAHEGERLEDLDPELLKILLLGDLYGGTADNEDGTVTIITPETKRELDVFKQTPQGRALLEELKIQAPEAEA